MAEERVWTNEQRDAIEAQGGSLLVTAAAGSGKTSVLTERIMRLITVDGTDIDRLLVVTFSRAAASEMRERISSGLSRLTAENPGDARLFDMQMKLNRASISTVHSFCASLIRDNFKSAGVENDFRLTDGAEYEVMKREALDTVLENKYAAGDADFFALADSMTADRDDSDLRGYILKLYDFLVSNDDREGWIGRVRESYGENGGTAVWEKYIIVAAREDLLAALAYLETAKNTAKEYEKLTKSYLPAIEDDIARIGEMLAACEKGDYEALISASSFKHEGFLPLRNFEHADAKESVANCRRTAKKIIEKLRDNTLCYTPERIRSDTAAMRPIVNALLDVLCDFTNALTQRKREQNVLAFDDLEYLAIKLLTQKNADGKRVRTPLAQEISDRFDEILIDEYQDTNPAQECIFNALSGNRGNIFAVGDAKQAIYAFRNASTQVFTDKKYAYSPYDRQSPAFPARIALSANFRSRPGVTRFINFICGYLFSRELGGVDYDESEKLIPNGRFAPDPIIKPEAELILMPRSQAGEKLQNTAKLIALKIKELVDSKTPVSDGHDALRPIRYSDIAIICRSIKNTLPILRPVFEAAGIPVDNPDGGLLFDDYSVNVVLSLLQVIDNPYQDVPLAGVMISPVFAFTPDDLSRMRTQSRRGSMYEAVRRYAENGDEKTKAFLDTLNSLRAAASSMPVCELILHVCFVTSATALLCAAAKDKSVKNRIEALLSTAQTFTDFGGRGLGAYLRYTERIKNVDVRSGGVRAPIADTGGGVKIVTVHASKGLEYPVVFTLCAGQFNKVDLTKTSLVHPLYGFGGCVTEGTVRYHTVQHEIIVRAKKNEMCSEELRVLYVALTRAVDKLYLVCVYPESKDYFAGFSYMSENAVIKKRVLKSRLAVSDWIVAAALTHPSARELCARAGIPPCIGADEADDTGIALVPDGSVIAAAFDAMLTAKTPAQDNVPAAVTDESRFSWEYPFENDVTLPTKVSASGVSHGGFTMTAGNMKPAFIGADEEVLHGARAGTAVHLFMSLFDFASKAPPKVQLTALTEGGRLSGPEAAAVDIAACETLVNSPLGERLIAAAKRGELLKEYGFSFRVDAAKIPGLKERSGKVLVSGVADLIFFEDGKTYIVDYKTDKADANEIMRRYSGQLTLYKEAASALWKKEVGGLYLWSFYNGSQTDVNEG